MKHQQGPLYDKHNKHVPKRDWHRYGKHELKDKHGRYAVDKHGGRK